MSTSITMFNAQQGHEAISRLWQAIKPRLQDGHRLTVSVAEQSRSIEQNAKLHATLAEIARQKEWAGQKWDTEVWKRLLTAAWMRARGERIMVVPALDGQGVDVVFRRTSSLTKAECSELLEFVIAWCAENSVATQ